MNTPRREIHLPANVTLSLRAGFVIAIANVLCVAILAWAWMRVKDSANMISVTGSAKQVIQSDLIVWEGKVSVNSTDLQKGYAALKAASDQTVGYLQAEHIAPNQISLSAIWMNKHFARDEKGNPTDTITSYDLIQTVQVASGDVAHVAEVSRKITSLIEQGITIESTAPRYLYTKMADLKITMLAEATKDASARARQIATNSGARLGTIRDARMGVMQINPVNSNEASDSGNNDTTSYEKEITAIVSAHFAVE